MKFAHLAQRLFNVPLAIHPRKAEVVLAALSERMGITRIVRLDGAIVEPRAFFDDDGDEFAVQGSGPQVGYDLVAGVAVIEVSGTLVKKLGELRPYSGLCGYDGIRQNLFAALSDPKASAICLLIDSPGGEVAGCFDLVDMIHQARGSKPIWAVLDDMAYSAAYAIASAADYVTVPRTGGTGSVGIIAMHVDFSKALSDAGLKVTLIQYGARKADGAPEIPLSPEAFSAAQSMINTMGDLFVETVARNRAIPASKVRDTQASVYLGAAGVDVGFADAVMAPDAAFQALLKQVG